MCFRVAARCRITCQIYGQSRKYEEKNDIPEIACCNGFFYSSHTSKAEQQALAELVEKVGRVLVEAGVFPESERSLRKESHDPGQETGVCLHTLVEVVEESDLGRRAELLEEEQCRRAEKNRNPGIALAAADR